MYTYNDRDYERLQNEIQEIDLKFWNALIESDLTTWANSKFPIRRFGKHTSNAAESMDAMLKKNLHYT